MTNIQPIISLGDGSPRFYAQGACAGQDTKLFYPEVGDVPSARAAKAICAECSVKKECLEYAIEHNERFGIWGGLTTKQRHIRMDYLGIKRSRYVLKEDWERKQFCRHGHFLSAENRVKYGKSFRCRECRLSQQASYRAREKEGKQEGE